MKKYLSLIWTPLNNMSWTQSHYIKTTHQWCLLLLYNTTLFFLPSHCFFFQPKQKKMDTSNEIVHDVFPYLQVYKNGTIKRLVGTEFTPATYDSQTNVTSKDVMVDPKSGISARIYRPNSITKSKKLPLVVYFHGGAFCISSVGDPKYHDSLNVFVSCANVVLVSVDYRLAPEHPLPTAYDDSWFVLQWVAQHKLEQGSDVWLNEFVDFDNVFLAGDSAGKSLISFVDHL